MLTSSIGASYPIHLGPKQADITINEDSWNPITIEEAEQNWSTGYSVSKKLAEEALWDFQKTHKPRFAVAAMVTPVAYGPPINQVTYSTLPSSVAFFKTFLDYPLDLAAVPPSVSGHADVRDIARAHVQATFDSRFDNGRWLIMQGISDDQTAMDILHNYRPKESANVVVGSPGSFNPDEFYKFENAKTRAILNFEFIPYEKSIVDQYDLILQLKKEEEEAGAGAAK